MTEELWRSMQSPAPAPVNGLRRTVWLLTAFVAGVVCLFCVYTAIFGMALLALGALTLASPRLFSWSRRMQYARCPYLDGPVRFRITEDGISARFDELEARSSWGNLVWYCVGDRYLRLQCGGMPEVWIAREDIERTWNLATVVALAEWRAPRFERAAI